MAKKLDEFCKDQKRTRKAYGFVQLSHCICYRVKKNCLRSYSNSKKVLKLKVST